MAPTQHLHVLGEGHSITAGVVVLLVLVAPVLLVVLVLFLARQQGRRQGRREVCAWITFGTVLYVTVSLLGYSVRHPELTQMQVFLDTWEALRWR